jgi:hypothetical protein
MGLIVVARPILRDQHGIGILKEKPLEEFATKENGGDSDGFEYIEDIQEADSRHEELLELWGEAMRGLGPNGPAWFAGMPTWAGDGGRLAYYRSPQPGILLLRLPISGDRFCLIGAEIGETVLREFLAPFL